MTGMEQVPFAPDFVENPEPRCPCILLLDTSGSMSGQKIAHLNEGLRTFAEEVKGDSMAAKRVEVAIVTFGPVTELQPFVTVDAFSPPTLTSQGETPHGRRNPEGCRRPWLGRSTWRKRNCSARRQHLRTCRMNVHGAWLSYAQGYATIRGTVIWTGFASIGPRFRASAAAVLRHWHPLALKQQTM